MGIYRQEDETKRYPSIDLLSLDKFWNHYYVKNDSFVLCLEVEQLARCYRYRAKLFNDICQLENVGKTMLGRSVVNAIRTSILTGVFECINWVDMLVRIVVLRGILLELSTDTMNFSIPAASEESIDYLG